MTMQSKLRNHDRHKVRQLTSSGSARKRLIGVGHRPVLQPRTRRRHQCAGVADPGPNATTEARKTWRDKRRAEGGKRTQLNKEALHCGLICEEIESRMAAGIPVVKSEVVNALVKAGTVKRSTA